MFNGNPNSRTLKVKGLEITLNYFFAALINLIDFALLFISWIPGLKNILDFMYRNPDIIEKQIPFLFGGSKGHRNFITHSVFNPVFLIYIFISSKLTKNTNLKSENKFFTNYFKSMALYWFFFVIFIAM